MRWLQLSSAVAVFSQSILFPEQCPDVCPPHGSGHSPVWMVSEGDGGRSVGGSVDGTWSWQSQSCCFRWSVWDAGDEFHRRRCCNGADAQVLVLCRWWCSGGAYCCVVLSGSSSCNGGGFYNGVTCPFLPVAGWIGPARWWWSIHEFDRVARWW